VRWQLKTAFFFLFLFIFLFWISGPLVRPAGIHSSRTTLLTTPTVHGKVGRQADRTKHATEKVPLKSYKNSTPCPDPHHHHRKDLDKARRLHVSPALPCPLFLFQIDKDIWVLVRFASYSTWPSMYELYLTNLHMAALTLVRFSTGGLDRDGSIGWGTT